MEDNSGRADAVDYTEDETPKEVPTPTIMDEHDMDHQQNKSLGTTKNDDEQTSEDYTKEVAPEKVSIPTIGGEYDPRPQQDAARRYIAYSLVGLLWAIVVALLALISAHKITAENLKDFSVILGPVVTLVSAATGFYYGSRSSSG